MKQHFVLFLLLIFSFIQVNGQISKIDALEQLDDILSKKEILNKIKEQRIDSLKHLLYYSEEKDKPSLYKKLHQEYFQYQNDSALKYAIKLHTISVKQRNKQESEYASNQIALCLGVVGAYLDTQHLLDSLRKTITSPAGIVRFYHTSRTIYGWAATYLEEVPRTHESYQKLTDTYKDSILLKDKNPISLKVCTADKYLSIGKIKKAQNILLDIEDNAQGDQEAYTQYLLAMTYKATGNIDKEIVHLAKTAMCDASMSKKEHAALLELAGVLYEQGDIDRSHRYLMHALEDAAFCNARLRSVEVARIYPIISSSYKKMMDKHDSVKTFALFASILLFICIISLVIYLYNRIKKLRIARRLLAETNKMLEATNHSLEKSNSDLVLADKIKEKYITIYLERCRSYMENTYERRKGLLKLARAGQYDELTKQLKSSSYMDQEKKLFYSEFDIAFLNIYPHFVDDFNSILQPEYQLIPKKGERLTTELRIFALIRLGITDTNKIAQFLDYSIPTIYQYRSRVRSNSILSKDEFEEKILTI